MSEVTAASTKGEGLDEHKRIAPSPARAQMRWKKADATTAYLDEIADLHWNLQGNENSVAELGRALGSDARCGRVPEHESCNTSQTRVDDDTGPAVRRRWRRRRNHPTS